MSASVSRLVLEVIAAYTPPDCCIDQNDGSNPANMRLFATLSAQSGVKATMDHIRLFATLEAEAEITLAKLNLGNKFPQTILYCEASIPKAYLTDVFSFKTTIGGEGGSELECFLTVKHDPSLFL